MNLQKGKLIIGIISDPKNVEIREAIRQTWLKKIKELGIDYFFIVGSTNAKSVTIKEDILTLPVKDCYENLPQKVALFYEYIYDFTKYEHVYKIDDDCYLNTDYLLKSNYEQYDYFGRPVGFIPEHLSPTWHYSKCSDPELNKTPFIRKYEGPWCGGGYGYFLSRNALKIIKQNKDKLIDIKFSGPGYEDVGIGYLLRQNNILPTGNENYSCLNPMECGINRDADEKFVDFIEFTVGEEIFNYAIILELKESKTFKYFYDIFESPGIYYQRIIKAQRVQLQKLKSQKDELATLLEEAKQLSITLEEKAKAEIAKIQEEAKVEIAKLQEEAKVEVLKLKAEMTRLQDEVRNEMIKLQRESDNLIEEKRNEIDHLRMDIGKLIAHIQWFIVNYEIIN